MTFALMLTALYPSCQSFPFNPNCFLIVPIYPAGHDKNEQNCAQNKCQLRGSLPTLHDLKMKYTHMYWYT